MAATGCVLDEAGRRAAVVAWVGRCTSMQFVLNRIRKLEKPCGDIFHPMEELLIHLLHQWLPNKCVATEQCIERAYTAHRTALDAIQDIAGANNRFRDFYAARDVIFGNNFIVNYNDAIAKARRIKHLSEYMPGKFVEHHYVGRCHKRAHHNEFTLASLKP
jgi:hypothetical protein